MTDAPAQDQLGPSVARYVSDIEAYEKEYRDWTDRGRGIIKRYKDQRDETNAMARRFNILWSNVQVMKPALYARVPKAEVVRRFKDADPVGRVAAEITERVADSILDLTDFDETMQAVMDDYLLPGRGILWTTYNAKVTEELVPGTYDEEGAPVTRPVKTEETITPAYVDWKDFGHNPARNWKEVRVAWKRAYMTRAELVDRFGDMGHDIPLDHGPESRDSAKDSKRKAAIYEVWDKEKRKVTWLHKSKARPLDQEMDPLNLQDFWPFPRPLYATKTSDSLIPVPDYAQYQDQAEELDRLTNRIHALTDALKVVGVYDASVAELGRLLQRNGTPDNTLVPVENWAAFAGKGGLDGTISFIPLEDVIQTLLSTYQAREQAKQTLFEVTGIADIVRGASNPNETLGAQQLKSQFGSIRIRDRQAEIARFARDTIRIVCEIAVEMFEPKTLWEMSHAQSFTDPQTFQAAVALLRDEKTRNFRIDIETDSTIQLDENAEKQNRIEFMGAFGGFLQQVLPVAQGASAVAPMLGEALKYFARGFKAGRQMEDSIEQTVDALIQQSQQPPQPSVEERRLQLDERKAQTDAQVKQSELMIKAAEAENSGANVADLKFQADENEKDRQAAMARTEMDNQTRLLTAGIGAV